MTQPSPGYRGRDGVRLAGSPVTRRDFLRRMAAGGGVLASAPFVAGLPPASRPSVPDAGGHGTAAGSKSQEIRLFNGRDLTGWDFYLEEEGALLKDVWSVEEGILVCRGEPQGYLFTRDDYESFRLIVEWRWPGEPGNSGVLLRVAPEPVMLPSCVEAQLRSGRAGDMYGFQGFTIGGDPERLSEISIGWSLRRMEGNENDPGEWNRYEITADGDRITLDLNGARVNEATGCEVRPGRIGLQSEGAPIHFRTVTLERLG